MASQFFGLNIAYKGLLASNAALNTTANNIANVQTEGYSRQQVQQQASTPIRVFQQYGCAGAGVDTLAIERVRDEFYDQKFWNNSSKIGEYDVKQYYMKQIEDYFDDDGVNTGFKTIFDKFMMTGMEELLKNPNDVNTKSQFIGAAGAVTEYFNGLAGNLENVQKDLNLEIKLKVDEINSLASEISTLNSQINTIELTGINANELRDQRSLLVDQLSKIIDVEVSETPIVDLNQPDRETGANRFMVKVAGGASLVDGNEYNGLECRSRKNYEKVNQTDIDGLYDVYWENGQEFSLYNASMRGALKGLVDLRDGNNSENFQGTISGVGTTDNGARDTVTIRVDKHYLMDLNKCNLSDQGGKINLGNKIFYYDSWEVSISQDANGEPVYDYTFTLSDSSKNDMRITNDRVGKMAKIGESLEYQGIPYYMNQMNEWIRTFSQKFNTILKKGYGSENRPGVILFTGNQATGEEQYNFPDETRYDLTVPITVNVSQDSYYKLTAKNFTILTAMERDPGLLANRYDQGDGVDQYDLLKDLKALAYTKDKNGFRGASPSEFLQNVLSDVALNASRANSFQKTFSEIGEKIDTQRISISGVDEDEEAVNLVKYQNGYNLASKMIQILTEIYDRLILETGV